MNWIDVTKQKPNELEDVLVVNDGVVEYCKFKYGQFVFEAYGSYGDDDSQYFTRVTHWIALDSIVLPS